jgi:outer membrane protein TolC
MRWIAVVVGLALTFAGTSGCKQQCFLTEAQYNDYQNLANSGLPCDPGASVAPPQSFVPAPPNVNDPEREPHYISLREAIAIALEQGTTGLQSARLPGTADDDLTRFSGNGVVQPDSIRVLALQPAIAGAAIEGALAKFDAELSSTVNITTTDEPAQGINSFQNGVTGSQSTTVVKPLPTGGIAGVTFANTYQLLNRPPTGVFGVLNPSWTSKLTFGFEQPLWQSAGVEYNQLAQIFPNSQLPLFQQAFQGRRGQVNLAGVNEGILVTRLRFDQQRADFQRAIHFLLLNVEVAYWNLYGAYVNLYSSEQALRQAHEAWRIGKFKYEAGKDAIQQFAPIRGQYEQFRGDRIQALGKVLEAERQLRAMLGMPIEDGKRLVPSDQPTLAPYQPDWNTALQETLTLRPELVLARQDIRAKQFNVILQRNYLKPDLRFTATYSPFGLGTRLDGNGNIIDGTGTFRPDNAWKALGSDHFNDWSMGLVFNMPIGFRAEHSTVRQANLQMAQAYIILKDQEERAQRFLAGQYRLIFENYAVIEARRAQRQAFAQQVDARFQEFVAGKTTQAEFLLEAQRQWAAALSAEYQAIVDYNNALAKFEFAKGTILEHDNVNIAEGPLPVCAQVRAIEHEKERTTALVLRERAQPVPHPSCSAATGCSGLPHLPNATAPSLPALLSGAPKVPDAPPSAPETVTQGHRPEAAPPVSLAPPSPYSAPTQLPALPRPATPAPAATSNAPPPAPAATLPAVAPSVGLPPTPVPVLPLQLPVSDGPKR